MQRDFALSRHRGMVPLRQLLPRSLSWRHVMGAVVLMQSCIVGVVNRLAVRQHEHLPFPTLATFDERRTRVNAYRNQNIAVYLLCPTSRIPLLARLAHPCKRLPHSYPNPHCHGNTNARSRSLGTASRLRARAMQPAVANRLATSPSPLATHDSRMPNPEGGCV